MEQRKDRKTAGEVGGLFDEPSKNGGTGRTGGGDGSTSTAGNRGGGGGTEGKGPPSEKPAVKNLVKEKPKPKDIVPVPPTPKKTTKKKLSKKEQARLERIDELAENISVIIKTGFELVAMRTDPLWCISTDEANSIAAPLARIMDRMELTEKIDEYGDYVALAAAAGWVVVPRFLMYQDKKKKGGARGGGTKRPDDITAEQGGPGNKPAPARSNNVKEFIPPIS